jgi:type IV secretion system protein VirB10
VVGSSGPSPVSLVGPPLTPSPGGVSPARTGGGPRRETKRERAERRMLHSPVFSHSSAGAAQFAGAAQSADVRSDARGEEPVQATPFSRDPQAVTEMNGTASVRPPADSTGSGEGRGLSTMLAAQPLPDLTWLLPKGASLDCTLETAIDSTLQGMTTCVTAVDVFGADGHQVVLPRGTQLVGETHGTVRAGQARVQVLWTEARTPTGVIVALASPGTDPLGRAGLHGRVERQFGERFGAAVLLSVIDGAIAAAVASQQHGSGGVYLSPSGAPSVMTELLKETAGVAPRIVKAQGDRVAVLVARNVDFRGVAHGSAAHRSPAGPADGSAAHGSFEGGR